MASVRLEGGDGRTASTDGWMELQQQGVSPCLALLGWCPLTDCAVLCRAVMGLLEHAWPINARDVS